LALAGMFGSIGVSGTDCGDGSSSTASMTVMTRLVKIKPRNRSAEFCSYRHLESHKPTEPTPCSYSTPSHRNALQTRQCRPPIPTIY
jgi:hypothetical protein